ncbi:pyrimidine 5'-nucleotidase [Oceanibacterium hippocampi]|uniref:Phosphoglycolate phosphatase n=1 Tax=Oceanibacterium hippocampi TaxID=745714 RepID=A0A1Y5RTU7_9PROT|nr:pyrimidine 5'-nucleotidase [Oceanibacterium hippocampi]SLN25330.1 Phosphoglycolate phosphatase [Oceanibacterium hippocampi]
MKNAMNAADSRKPDLAHVRFWVFDLDNTLYPASSNLFPQVSRRMGEFIAGHFDVDLEAARAMQKHYFRQHGTTLRGLMLEHGIDAQRFLDYVHDIDLSVLEPAPALGAALAALPGRLVVYTNGSTAHAERILDRLGIADIFEGIFDIVAADFVPKPERGPYEAMLKRFGAKAETALMAEDIAKNLVPAHDLGMTTLWIPGPVDWAAEGAEGEHVHYVADDLAEWLAAHGAPAD